MIHMTTIGYDAIMSLKIRNGVTLHDVSIYDPGRRNGDCSFTNRGKDGMKKLIVNFERPTEDGFDSARCELPDYKWTERQGYSDEEIAMFEELLHSNAHLLYRYTENGGGLG